MELLKTKQADLEALIRVRTIISQSTWHGSAAQSVATALATLEQLAAAINNDIVQLKDAENEQATKEVSGNKNAAQLNPEPLKRYRGKR